MLAGLGAQAAYGVVLRKGEALQSRFAAQKTNEADAARFRAAAATIRDAEGLLKDRRSLQVVLEAFQLETEIDKRGLLRKVLTQDPADRASVANRLTDQRWRQLAAAFGGRGNAPLGDAGLVDRLLRQAMTNRYEKALGEDNAGLREAAYFTRMASQVTTIPQLMSDKAMLAVARGALGLPEQFGLLDYDKQKAVMARRLDIATLQDSREVQRMAQRYLTQLARAEVANATTALFDNSGSASGIVALAGRRVSFTA